MGKKKLFDRCIYCGCTVYIDGLGDDVIPAGFLEEEGWACEYCHSDEEEVIE